MQSTYRGLEITPNQKKSSTPPAISFPMIYRGQRQRSEDPTLLESESSSAPSPDKQDWDFQDQNRASPLSQLVHAFCQGNWGIIDRWLSRQFYRLSRWFRQQRF